MLAYLRFINLDVVYSSEIWGTNLAFAKKDK